MFIISIRSISVVSGEGNLLIVLYIPNLQFSSCLCTFETINPLRTTLKNNPLLYPLNNNNYTKVIKEIMLGGGATYVIVAPKKKGAASATAKRGAAAASPSSSSSSSSLLSRSEGPQAQAELVLNYQSFVEALASGGVAARAKAKLGYAKARGVSEKELEKIKKEHEKTAAAAAAVDGGVEDEDDEDEEAKKKKGRSITKLKMDESVLLNFEEFEELVREQLGANEKVTCSRQMSH
jgi:hypothetical protein